MKKTNRFLRLTALSMVLCIFVSMMAACGKKNVDNPTELSTQAAKTEYTVRLRTEGGKALEGIGIYIYTDDTLQELENFVKTDAQGTATFSAAASDSYVAVLEGTPDGYAVEESYGFSGTLLEITLAVAAGDGDLSQIEYQLGDVMLDFTVIDCDAEAHVLSELLKTKKAVVLNFWYTACNPCKAEFPYMQEAYEKYAEDIEILAMNPVDQSEEAVIAFRDALALTMPVAAADPDWEKAMQLKAYPTTVVIDRFGTIAMIHQGSIQDTETFERIFAFFTDEEYVQTTVESIDELPELEVPGSNADNPIEIGSVTSFEVTVKPGQLIYYHLYRVNQMYLNIYNENAYVVYNQRTYEPQNGNVSLTLYTPDTYTPARVAFGNGGKETVTYTVQLAPMRGTISNPYSLKLGEFTTSVRVGNDQGVCYNHQVTETGLFTIRCLSVTEGVRYDYSLYNLNTYGMRTLREDGIEDAEGNDIVSVYARAGDTIQVIVSTLPDSSNTYPAANFTTLAYMIEGGAEDENKEEEKLLYAVTVTDADRKPISGVVLTLDINGKSVAMATDENGVAYTKQVEGVYDVTLRIPDGYTISVTQYQLTPEMPMISLKLDQIVEETATYTVRVLNQDGEPVSGALVMIGSTFAVTDASGNASFTLPKAEYTVKISVDGNEAQEFVLSADTAELIATIETEDEQDQPTDPTEPEQPTDPAEPTDPEEPTEEPTEAPTEPEDTTIVYTVQVKDYQGNGISGAVAMFGGATIITDANGIASAKLEPDTYAVQLAFSGNARYYEESLAVMTADAPSVTILVADGVEGEYDTLYQGGAEYKAYFVEAGGTYVTMQSDVINYYLFSPETGEDGQYRISTSDPSAILSFWGASTAYIYDSTASTDYADNSFTLNIKASNIGATYVLGITGASDCILEITRIGDAILSDADLTPVEWIGSSTPSSVYSVSGVSGKTMKFVDLTGNANAVYNSADGMYHLNSADGPVLYLATGYLHSTTVFGTTRWIRFSDAFAVTNKDAVLNFIQIYTDDNGNRIKERYNDCMKAYIECADTTYGVYPLTSDLIYMIQQGGAYRGWFDASSANYVVPEDERSISYNESILWMFNCCYFE